MDQQDISPVAPLLIDTADYILGKYDEFGVDEALCGDLRKAWQDLRRRLLGAVEATSG